MQLDIHRLERKYAHLRRFDAKRKARLTASLAEHGQQQPVLVVASTQRDRQYVLIDGYVRVGAIEDLGRDVVEVLEFEQSESEALILAHTMSRSEARSALEQAWLIRELVEEHGKDQQELAERFGRSRSWVSRRLALLIALPPIAEDQVRSGTIAPQAAMKYLVPLARANRGQCERLATNLRGQRRLSVREIGRIYAGWRVADAPEREKIVEQPLRFLDISQALSDLPEEPQDPDEQRERKLLDDLGALAGICSRVRKALNERASREKSLPWPTVLRFAWQEAQAAFATLLEVVTEQRVSGNDA